MIGVDTNVIVRYLVQDDPAQSRRATALFEREGEQFHLGQIVLCELVWVLSFAYGYRRGQIVPVLRQLLRTAQFEIEAPDIVRRAVEDYARGKGDFADLLIRERNEAAGCGSTVTFDRKLQRVQGFGAP